MATLIYAPGIRVHIETSSGILDVSDDLVQWELDLPENAVHALSFSLQNAQRKYDGLIMPMDRISVQLKRLNWLDNFTGYLNDGPIFQAWPSTLEFTASCTLKVPQYYYWDPTSVDSQAMIQNAFGNVSQQIGSNTDGSSDNGLSSLAITALTQVVGWPASKIHISQIPSNWFTLAQQIGNEIIADNDMSTLMGSAATVGGSSVGSLKVNLPTGTYAQIVMDAQQAANISLIYNTVRFTLGGTSREAKLALMCVADESGFRNHASEAVAGSTNYPHDDVVKGDHQSVGLFQQQPGSEWGTLAQCMDPVQATTSFFNQLKKKEGSAGSNSTLTDWALIQLVQASGTQDGSNYERFENLGVALVTLMDNLSLGLTTNPGSTAGIGSDIANSGTHTGTQVAASAVNIIVANPPGHILYHEGGDDADTNPDPRTLDCSSFTDMAYFRATGQHLWKGNAGRSTAQSISTQCISIPLDLGYQIQGAALFHKAGSTMDHVAVSLGTQANGQWQSASANTDGVPAAKQVDIENVGSQFTNAGLLPGIDYSSSAANATAAAQLKAYIGGNPTSAPALSTTAINSTTGTLASGGTADTFSTFINALALNITNTDLSGNYLKPERALMNNQPFLPWLQNVLNGSMRSFCSAPNGDLIAWFPDYFGYWGTAGIVNIEQIELQNFTVNWSDQQMVTHQFVIGSQGASTFNSSDASLDPIAGLAQNALFASTEGIATMDYPEIFQAIYGASANPAWRDQFIQRFGARPDIVSVPQIAGGQNSGRIEFFMALYLFMQRWANMFTASIPLTFMPEIYPGMLLRIPDFGFQCYVTGVTHSGSYGPDGGFTTTVTVCAPTSTTPGSQRGDLLGLLPAGGAALVGNTVETPVALPTTTNLATPGRRAI